MFCCDFRVQNQSSHEILKKKKSFQKFRFYQNAFEIKMNQIKKKAHKNHIEKMIWMHMTKRMIKRIIKRMIKRTIKRIVKHKAMHIVIKSERTAVIFKLFQCWLIAFKHINQKSSSYDSTEHRNWSSDLIETIDHLI